MQQRTECKTAAERQPRDPENQEVAHAEIAHRANKAAVDRRYNMHDLHGGHGNLVKECQNHAWIGELGTCNHAWSINVNCAQNQDTNQYAWTLTHDTIRIRYDSLTHTHDMNETIHATACSQAARNGKRGWYETKLTDPESQPSRTSGHNRIR